MIIFIKHIDIEGPETIGRYFADNGFEIKIIDLPAQDSFPKDFDDVDAVVSLGGPMNVYEEDKYPFLATENDFVQRIIKEQIPFIGICLGSQILAKACASSVVKSPEKEIGFFDIGLTEEGLNDPLFAGVDPTVEVYQWHEDMFEIPQEAKLLASSGRCPHQAFKIGSCAYGLQFHIEITDKSIREWSDRYFKDAQGMVQKQKMLEDYQQKEQVFQGVAQIIYKNFLSIIKNKTKVL